MKYQRRFLSLFVGAVAFGVLAVPRASWAQTVDNRPVYYVMLKSLEDAFQAYNAALESQLNAHASRLASGYQSERLTVSKKLEALDEKRSRGEAKFNAEREALNEKIASIEEKIKLRDGRANEERRIERLHSPRIANDPRIKSLKERIATELAELDAVRATYLSELQATQEARGALTTQIEEYVSAGDPLALEIRSLDEDWQRFAEQERRKLKQMADGYADEYAAYDEWLGGERKVLEKLNAAIERDQKTDREQRALHAQTQAALNARIDEYNALVEKHNKAGPDDPGRDERATKFAALEDEISDLQATLSQARDAVVTVTAELEKKNQELAERYERFVAEKRERDTRLAAELAKIDAARLTVEAAIDERRRNVDAQIRSLEAHISAELGDARESLEKLNARLIADFGRDHEGFDAAITRVLETSDDGLLYTPAGAPRFDLSRPLTARVYTAVERLEADRREIDARIAAIEQDHGKVQQQSNDPPPPAGALERERADLSNQRQQLLESFAAQARKIQSGAAALEEQRRGIDSRLADERAALEALYSARAQATHSEMLAVQQVLAAAARGEAVTNAVASDHARLLAALEEKAGAVKTPVQPSLLAANPLMDEIAESAALESTVPYAGSWVNFSARKIAASRELTGSDKAALAAAWLEQLRRRPEFTGMITTLDASGAVKDAGRALSSLFMSGVMEHMTITEQRLDDGAIGIQVSVLGRDYLLNAGGSLEHFPRA